MGWELTDFRIEHYGEQARVFTFEVRIDGSEPHAPQLLSGDGVVLGNGKVRLNREEFLAAAATRKGLNAQALIDGLKELALAGELRTEPAKA
jgi:hypothetical protein